MIKIANIKNYVYNNNEVFIKVDRSSVLGNKFFMRTESERDKVCEQYEQWLMQKIKDKTDRAVLDELNRIWKIAKSGKTVVLGCWCYPKRCHSETIKRVIESKL